ELIDRYANETVQVVLRVNPGVEAHTHEFIQTGQEVSKFGLSIQYGLPIVFDPVAVGASTYRKQFCKLFLKSANVSVIQGHASEILALLDDTATMNGPDSDAHLDAVTIAKKAYALYQTAIVITGNDTVL
uniref:hydroxyethylthiazole kinase n=1 Tax=Staphylococcus aureus TaxID=1280 RepID=UPI002108F875